MEKTTEEKVKHLEMQVEILFDCIRGLIRCNNALTNQVKQLAENQIKTSETVVKLISE